ncbi:MAG: flagellar FliJ family protein [bacterium]
MKGSPFRYETLLEVVEKRLDGLQQDLSRLRTERRAVRQEVQALVQERRRVESSFQQEELAGEVGHALDYLAVLLQRTRLARGRDEALRGRIQEKVRALREVHTERKRFGRLKERHQKDMQRCQRVLEQKVTDEFSQRNRKA